MSDLTKEMIKDALTEILTPELLGLALKKVFSPNRVKAMSRGSLTFRQAALHKGVGIDKIKEKIAAGELEYFTEGKTKRILKSALDKMDFIKSGRTRKAKVSAGSTARDKFQAQINQRVNSNK